VGRFPPFKKHFSQGQQGYNPKGSGLGSGPPKGSNSKSGRRPKIFEPPFLKKSTDDFPLIFCVERAYESPSMCKFWGKSYTGKNLRTKFSKISLGGPDPQTMLNIPTRLGMFVGGIDPHPTVPVISFQAQSFLRYWGSKKNLWRHLAPKPEVAWSRDLD